MLIYNRCTKKNKVKLLVLNEIYDREYLQHASMFHTGHGVSDATRLPHQDRRIPAAKE